MTGHRRPHPGPSQPDAAGADLADGVLDGPLKGETSAQSPNGANCLVPWHTTLRPSQGRKLIIDAHRDDWP
jgi:hypothetical protein